MSSNFQTCPGCDSFILSDTAQCPECGHVLDENRIGASDAANLKTQEMYDTCRSCGESVRSGLVRCWSCNTFMRDDVAARYEEMQATPQRIIFSDIPEDERTELITDRSRDGGGYGSNVFDAVDDESDFTLTVAQPDFELSPAAKAAGDAAADAGASAAHVQQSPASVTPAAEQPPATPQADDTVQPKPDGDQTDGDAPAPEADLVGLAMEDQRETRKRKRSRMAESRRKRLLLPCTACGSWMRVHQEQGGKAVRCGQCKARVVVPMMKKKEKPAAAKKEKTAKIKVRWLDDVRLHIISPTDVVLKPGSMEKTAEIADVAADQSGLHLVLLAPPARKSLFGKAAEGPPPVDEQRKQIREHIETTGQFTDVPFGTVHSIPAEQSEGIRLVQPVTEAHASMFAGVPVFGEGRVAVHLPLAMPDDKHALLSFSLMEWRPFAERLSKVLGRDVGATANGVPASDAYQTVTCEVSGETFQSLQDVLYYEKDPSCELEICGYKCEKCGIAVSEAGRARTKLGGAKGKGIAKAKCPKCTSKMGDQKLWKLVKSAEDDAPTPIDDEQEAAEEFIATAFREEMLQGAWRMISRADDGKFEHPADVSRDELGLKFAGNTYTISANESVVERGTFKLVPDEIPVWIDNTITEGDNAGQSYCGVFQMSEGRLITCLEQVGKPRPRSFNSDELSTATLAVFVRPSDKTFNKLLRNVGSFVKSVADSTQQAVEKAVEQTK